jgi:hypothetical protein
MTTAKKDRFAKFKEWIVARGAELMAPTNEWEAVRFRGEGRTSIIYVSKAGNITFTGEARAAWDAFEAGGHYRFAPRARRDRFAARASVVTLTLLDRDGPRCFYCAVDFSDDVKPTKEHLVPITAGGPDHLGNLFLACEPCNRDVGHRSAAEKIRYRDLKRRGAGTALLIDIRPILCELNGATPTELIGRLDAIIHHQPKDNSDATP